MPLVLCVYGLACALATLISLRPPMKPGAVALGGFFIGWLVSELPLHHIALQLGIGVFLVATGGLSEWPGWIGLVALMLSLLGLRRHLILAARTTQAVERGLQQTLGRDYHDHIDPRLRDTYDPSLNWSWLRLATIFPFRPRHIDCIRHVEYHREGKVRLRLDVYRGRGTDELAGPRPVFVYVHGGGWVIGNKAQQGRLTIHDLAAGGWVCVSVNYRLSPRATFPDHLMDIKRALAWVKVNIATYGGDPDFVVIGGGSAGAHLASLAALTAGRPEYQPGFTEVDLSVRGCIAYYGVFDFVDDEGAFQHRGFRDLLLRRLVMKKRIEDDRAAYERASPVYQVHADAPPFLIVHGDRDSLAPIAQARRFRDQLAAVSRAHVGWIELPGAQHAFEVFPSLRSVVAVHGVHRFCQVLWSVRQRTRQVAPATGATVDR
ncbi:MAG TPA: alpha/beta hydrolase [Kofleriaceae bacterium]|nr:alpha/beta hydrolase [Kofleriaceae bacterium]